MTDSKDLAKLTTEAVNPKSVNIDSMDSLQLVQLINSEDATVAASVAAAAQDIAAAIDCIVDRLREGGRLIYIGAGTSGRLGVLDASECPPTFSTPPGMVVGLIAGGDTALRTPVEGAEDSLTLAAEDLAGIGINARDCLVGIASSGRTPYVIGGLQFARMLGCATIGHSCNASSEMAAHCDILITTVVGPEVISGFDADEIGHCNQDGLEHVDNCNDGSTGQDLRQSDGRPTRLELETDSALPAAGYAFKGSGSSGRGDAAESSGGRGEDGDRDASSQRRCSGSSQSTFRRGRSFANRDRRCQGERRMMLVLCIAT